MRAYAKFWLIGCWVIAASAMGQSDEVSSGSPGQGWLLDELLEPSSTKVFIAAHRGGYESDRDDEAPENSLANIRNSESKGYEMFETDIQRTKDGHFVMVHDPTIERETSGEGRVAEMSLEELRSFRKRYRDGSLSSESVATLREFLREGRGRTVFKADLKPGVSSHFLEILEIVAEEDALEGIVFRVPYREADFYARCREEGAVIAEHSLMFKVSSRAQIDDVKARFQSSTIEIVLAKAEPPREKSLDLIRYATAQGFVVEAHAEGREEDWRKLIDAGVRIFHATAPSRVQRLLQVTGK